MAKILISGYYGYDNLGDEAVLGAIINFLRSGAKNPISITVLSAFPEKTARRYHVKAVNRYNPLKIMKELIKCDLFISGGGSLLQDITGWKTVPYYLSFLFLARILRKKTVIYAQGVGPLKRKASRVMVKWVLKGVDFISVRDKKSKQLLSDIVGIPEHSIYKSVDPVFGIEPSRSTVTEEKPLVGFALRPWNNGNYLEELSSAADVFLRDIGAEGMLVPLNQEKDREVCRIMSNLMWEDINISKGNILPQEAPRFFSKFNFFVGVRLHSLIFAALQGIPFFALSYDPKIIALMDMLDLDYYISIEDCSFSRLRDGLFRAWEDRELIREKLLKLRPKLKKKAEKNAEIVLDLLQK